MSTKKSLITQALTRKLKTPQFPPSVILLLLIGMNLYLRMWSQYAIVYEFMIYIYGMLALFDFQQYANSFQLTIVINLIMAGIDFSSVQLTHKQQFVMFAILCFIWRKGLYSSILELFGSFDFSKPVSFSQVFVCIQYITVHKFIVYFTGLKIIGNVPLYIRIFQNLRIGTLKARLAILRFLLVIAVVYVSHIHILQLGLRVFIMAWLLFVDFKLTFGMLRIPKAINYPTVAYVVGFGFDFGCRVSWMFMDPSYALLISVLRRVVQNFFRLQHETHKRKGIKGITEITETVIRMHTLHDDIAA